MNSGEPCHDEENPAMAIVAGVLLSSACLRHLDGQAAVASIRGRLPDELTVGVRISSRMIPFSVLGSRDLRGLLCDHHHETHSEEKEGLEWRQDRKSCRH